MIWSEWKIWAGTLAIILAGATWFYVGQLRAEKDLAVMQMQTLARENAGLAAEVETNRRALEARARAAAVLAAEKAELETKLKEVYQNDPKARAWADSPCPDGVLDCLRR